MTWTNSTQLDNATLDMFRNKTVSNAISILYIIVLLINVPGNGLSLWLLAFRTSPKSASIIFMINLTITDLAVGCVLPFQIAYQTTGYNWHFGPHLCRVMTVMFYANMYCSILTMTAISVERYLGIVRPIQFKHKKSSRMCAILGCLAMWAIVLVALYPLQSTDLTYEVKDLNITTCFDVLKKDMLPSIAAWAVFLITLFFILFLIPFLITVFCYISIIRALVNSEATAKKRSLRLAFLVLLVFVICFAPNNIILLSHIVRRLFYNGSLYMQYKLTLSLSCINSCLDPFIYYLASKEFRRKLRAVLGMHSNSSGEMPMTDYHRGSIFSAGSVSHGNANDTDTGAAVARKSSQKY